MKPDPVLRATLVAICLVSLWISTALAHALPGSTITLKRDRQHLKLTISLPLEDLVIASPSLRSLEDEPLELTLSKETAKPLERYIKAHLHLWHSNGNLPLVFTSS